MHASKVQPTSQTFQMAVVKMGKIWPQAPPQFPFVLVESIWGGSSSTLVSTCRESSPPEGQAVGAHNVTQCPTPARRDPQRSAGAHTSKRWVGEAGAGASHTP